MDQPVRLSRAYFKEQFALLPEACKALVDPPPYPVSLSPGLAERQAHLEAELHARVSGEH